MLWLRTAKNGTKTDEPLRILAKEARQWKLEGQTKEYWKYGVSLMLPNKMLEDRGALQKEDGNQMREYQAMQEEKFLSSWMREGVKGRKAEMERLNEEAKHKVSKSEKREVWTEGERVDIKRMCLNRMSSGFFEDVSPMTERDSHWGTPWVFGGCACCFFVCDCYAWCACFPFGCECGW